MGRERHRLQRKADAHQCEKVPNADKDSRNTLEVTGSTVNSTLSLEKQESAPKSNVKCITNAVSVCRKHRGSAGPSEKVATPAKECKIELLEGQAFCHCAIQWSLTKSNRGRHFALPQSQAHFCHFHRH